MTNLSYTGSKEEVLGYIQEEVDVWLTEQEELTSSDKFEHYQTLNGLQ